MTTERWEDVIPIWRDPGYGDHIVPFDRSVGQRPVAGGIITCAEPVDWCGNGGRDLLLSAWDACYGAKVRLFRQTGTAANGLPSLTYDGEMTGVSGFVTVVHDGDSFHLLSTSRLRRSLYFYRNIGKPGQPRFGDPIELHPEADWLHDGEIFHLARFHDIDGDGRRELVLGTDYWHDYWPEGAEWNDKGYRPYGVDGRWRGGPLRGNLYIFRDDGAPDDPRLGRGRPATTDDDPIEVYGQLGPTFGDFRRTGHHDLICGSFLDQLYFFPRGPDGNFGAGRMIAAASGRKLTLPHCIHMPAAVDWDDDGHVDLVVGAEDGRVWFVQNSGIVEDGVPVFEKPVPICSAAAEPQLGALPVPAIADWSGTGRLDLITGNSAGELLYAPVLGRPEAPALGALQPIDAGGTAFRVAAGSQGSIQGPSEYKFGYTCPSPCHWYGQDRPDIMTSDIFGRYLVLRNLGGTPPRFSAPCELQFDGQPLRTVWRVRPAVTRWHTRDMLHLVTLDAEGVLVMFDKVSDNEVANKRPLLYADGGEIRFTEDHGGGRGRIKLCVCDWRGSGRLDIIFGTHNRASIPPGPEGIPRHTTYQAGVFLLENVEGSDEPRFAPPRPFRFRGEPLVLGMHACSPDAVSWRQRDLPDLAIGVEDGSLVWFERETLTW
ncbi:VCBS repeat-containing protein [Telmatospirillum sp.]|uniref:FG-GAP repeat domain-containing protein n=1 Tax=Telmatospirillum sp. TaxID=2079197 RepID=UPI002850C057|nr:VCBS repeat-containing protein [Telmatospirillum sp.]MDR3439391.1 VCBS repeat-containing protein [Telmatospirillum sp.]